jgi:hypothetical protein
LHGAQSIPICISISITICISISITIDPVLDQYAEADPIKFVSYMRDFVNQLFALLVSSLRPI